MHQIHCSSGFFGVVEVRPADAAQPEPPVGVAGPYERAFVELGKTGNPTDQPLLFAWPSHGLPEPAQTELASTINGGLQLEGIVAGSHRRPVHGDHATKLAVGRGGGLVCHLHIPPGASRYRGGLAAGQGPRRDNHHHH